jgi:S-adenosylmethionine synthetase
LDLTNIDGIEKFVNDVKPDFIVHCAAQRFPDKMEKDPEAARKLNVEATKALTASLSKHVKKYKKSVACNL